MADRVGHIKVAPADSTDSPAKGRRASLKSIPKYEAPKETPPFMVELISGKVFNTVITVLTVFALFGDDFRLAATPKSTDALFFSISCVALLLFMVELVVNSVYKAGYLLGFYFWLDFFATFSLIPDIGWIWDIITGVNDNGQGGTEALKAGRASRAGTKAGRIVRVIRIIRMVRIVKLYKMTNGKKNDDLDAQMQDEPSAVGKKLTELTTRRVIMLVLLMLIVLPLFDGGYDGKENKFQQSGLDHIHHYAQMNSTVNGSTVSLADSDFMHNAIIEYSRTAGRIFFLEVQNVPFSTSKAWLEKMDFTSEADPLVLNSPPTTNPYNGWNANLLWANEAGKNSYRTTEAVAVTTIGCYGTGAQSNLIIPNSECVSVVYFDDTAASQASAAMNIAKTFFVMLILGAGVMMFTRDAENLVIIPIERMVTLVKKLAENPLASTKNDAQKILETEEDKEAQNNQYETAILESTLSKISKLLQVGFGEAGAEIIGKNMGTGGELDPMIPGKKITAIFGFCDIRMFTDTTECLQEEVMVYVNKIGEIVHSCTHEYYGAANKNIGDAFLLAWKMCDGDLPEDGQLLIPTTSGRSISPTEMCDSALTAFLRIQVELDAANTAGTLTEYASHPAVLKRFGPGFRIRMGFGMHVGWSIEGAVGSLYKIDATYLSPNVNMSARLEAATKQFRTPLLLSHWFVDWLSPAARRLCRRIDCVLVKGSLQPMTLYTYDIENMVPGFAQPVTDDEGTRCPVDFKNDPQFRELHSGILDGFFETFDAAYDSYIAGDWVTCRDNLEAALALKPDDGPAVSLMIVIKKANFQAPDDWEGVRTLDEK